MAVGVVGEGGSSPVMKLTLEPSSVECGVVSGEVMPTPNSGSPDISNSGEELSISEFADSAAGWVLYTPWDVCRLFGGVEKPAVLGAPRALCMLVFAGVLSFLNTFYAAMSSYFGVLTDAERVFTNLVAVAAVAYDPVLSSTFCF